MAGSVDRICIDRSVLDNLFTTLNWKEHFEACIEEGLKVDSVSFEDGWTLLHYAIEAENFEAADWLLKNGANIDSQDTTGCSPLHCAVLSDIEMAIAADMPIEMHSVKFLISHGADINLRNKQGQTPGDIAKSFGIEAHQRYSNLLS